MAQLVIEKQVSNAVLYTNGMIMFKNVRASYPHVDKAFKGKGQEGDAKFSITGMLPKETHVAAKDLAVEVMNRLMKEAKCAKLAGDKKFCRNGDDSSQAEYENHWTVSASESRRPSVRDRRGELILDEQKIADMIYGGCYVNILVRPWFQDNDYGKRVNAGLVGVQFVKDGEPFGEGRIDDTGAWDSVDDDDDGMGDDGDDDGL